MKFLCYCLASHYTMESSGSKLSKLLKSSSDQKKICTRNSNSLDEKRENTTQQFLIRENSASRILERLTLKSKPTEMKNYRKYTCSICMNDTFTDKEMVQIHKKHYYTCKECIVFHAESFSRSKDLFPFKCISCNTILSTDIFSKFVDKDTFAKIKRFDIEYTTQMEIILCHGCQSPYSIDTLNEVYVECPTCRITLLDKKDYTEELDSLAENEGWQKCPQCQMYIERIDGCNEMTHEHLDGSVCNFCYCCGDYITDNHFPNGSFNPCINSPDYVLGYNSGYDSGYDSGYGWG